MIIPLVNAIFEKDLNIKDFLNRLQNQDKDASKKTLQPHDSGAFSYIQRNAKNVRHIIEHNLKQMKLILDLGIKKYKEFCETKTSKGSKDWYQHGKLNWFPKDAFTVNIYDKLKGGAVP